jgi:rubrerythrin
MPDLNLNLIQNSHSFVNEALAKAVQAEKDPRQWQFAIFALVQAIELALKERLRQEHPVFIFKSVDERRHTVSLEQAAKRLKELAKVSITETDMSAIRTAIEWRNLIVHYEFEFSTEALKPVFAKLLGFLVDFHKSNLDLSLADHVSTASWDEAVSIAEYGSELFDRAQIRFETEKIDLKNIWSCPRCGSDAFVIQDNINTCYVCNFQDEILECNDCQEFFFRDDMHKVIKLVGRDREVETLLCSRCYEKHQWYEDEQFYDPDMY